MIRKRIAVLVGLLIAVSLVTAAPVLAAPPGNDTLAGIQTIVAPFSDTVDTSEATTDADDLDIAAGCIGVPALDASVWYEITPPSDTFLVVDISASSYSAGAIIATGGSGAWTVQACGPGAVVWDAAGGETYTLLVFDDQEDGTPADGGTLEINVEEVPPPPDVSVTINPRGSFNSKTGSATIRGTVTCSGGEAEFTFIDVFVRQKVGRLFIEGSGFVEGFTCDGSTQSWSVEVFGNGLFKGGRTATVTFAIACGEFLCGEGFQEAVVSLSGKKK